MISHFKKQVLGKANGAPPVLTGSSGFDSHPEIFYEVYEKFRGWKNRFS
ncbi:hypothetical protein BSM4216_2210 [Bacillus smithii]|nr:hypothetical protein BSM4216_2210 [Bacillus smithii]